MRPGLFRRMRLSIKTRRRQYITVNTDTPENTRSRSALLRSVMFVTALCMTVLVAAVGYSAVKYADEYRSTHSHNGTYDEPNTVKRQYIVPSGTASGASVICGEMSRIVKIFSAEANADCSQLNCSARL